MKTTIIIQARMNSTRLPGKVMKKIVLRNNLKIKIFGLPTLAKFSIESTNFQAYKTFITQEMLKKGFLAANGVYISCSHNEKILKKYEEVLDEIFFNISKCERKELNIYDILNFPVSRVPFGRLN